MSQSDSISVGRLQRLSSSRALLGEPDIISIRQTRSTASSFFQKQKRQEDLQENFINGLIFPTTAHFSSFISTRYKGKDPARVSIKAKLFMFDAYGEKDLQIEISIPGSLQVRTFDLKRKECEFSNQDYERAYYSSFLRSLYPMNFPQIVLYPLLNRIEIMRQIIRNFVIFSFKQELRTLDYEFAVRHGESVSQNYQARNLSLEIAIRYCLDNKFDELLKVILQELKKMSPSACLELQMESRFLQKKYGEIIGKTAQKLLLHGQASRMKQYQVRALFHVKKYSEAAFIGRTLILSGGTSYEIYKLILSSLVEIRDDKRFIKTLNLISNMHNHGERQIMDVAYQHSNATVFQLEKYVGKNRAISEYPELCFQFDNRFFNRLTEYQQQRQLLQKNSKEGVTVSILEKVEESLAAPPPLFYQNLVAYEKQYGWKNLLRLRKECFWLESDFVSNEDNTVIATSDRDDYSFFGTQFEDREEELHEEEFQIETTTENKAKGQGQKAEEKAEDNGERKIQASTEKLQLEQSFDGNLSEHEDPNQIAQLPKCSTRLKTLRMPQAEGRLQSKILCGQHLQTLFKQVFNDIKLQISLQHWKSKLNEIDAGSFSPLKKELTAMIYLKKGFLHRKLQRNKKCEESFKMARKFAQSNAVGLVATYQLILLYVGNRNVKGVEFYLVDLMRVLKLLGIESIDTVPEWAKPILQFVVHCEGLSIIKNIHMLFRNVFSSYLRSNFSEEQVEKIVQLRRA